MRVLLVSPWFYPATYWGGPIYSTFGLCRELAYQDNVELVVLTTDTSGPRRRNRLALDSNPTVFAPGFKTHYFPRLFGESGSPQLCQHILSYIRWADVVHLNAVYSFPTIPTLFACRLLQKPLVWSPRGAFLKWGHERGSKLKPLWDLICNALLVPNRCALHVTSNQEVEDSGTLIPKARVAKIPNGTDIPDPRTRNWLPNGLLRALFVGRLHPIKGIENLLGAIGQLRSRTRIHLTIAGQGDPAYERSLREVVEVLGITQYVTFVGQIDSQGKSDAFFDADVCIVPSHSENFGMVVAEALAHGVPVIASSGTPWQELESKQCGFWVPNDPQSLAKTMMRLSEMDLPGMGARGRDWMMTTFAWRSIASQMRGLYDELMQSRQQRASS